MSIPKDRQPTAKASRQSNLELLRILMMILIVAHHFAIYSSFDFSSASSPMSRIWLYLLRLGGKIGVNVYVLISGYFLVRKDSLSLEKAIRLWLQIFFYAIGIWLLLVFFGKENFSFKLLIQGLTPVTTAPYWFASTYFVLYLCTPFINRFLNSLDRLHYRKMLLGCLIMWSVIPTLTKRSFQCSNLVWFFAMYSLAGYVRLHVDIRSISKKRCAIAALLSIGFAYLFAVMIDALCCARPSLARYSSYSTYFYDMYKLPVVIASLSLFLLFLATEIRPGKRINLLASASFGVYLIHEHPFLRDLLWGSIVKGRMYENSPLLIPFSLFSIAAVYILCSLIELARIHLLENRYAKAVQAVAVKAPLFLSRLLQKLKKR